MRLLVLLAAVVHTDALTLGSAARVRLQHRRGGTPTAGIFDKFVAANDLG